MHAYNVLAVSEVHMNSLSVPYFIRKFESTSPQNGLLSKIKANA